MYNKHSIQDQSASHTASVASANHLGKPGQLAVVQNNLNWVGGNFFRLLVSQLTSIFNVRYALVTEGTDRSLARLRTLAYVDGAAFFENFEYPVLDTPCAGVVAGALCYYPEKLNDRFCMGLGEESYLGLPLYDMQGAILGHLALLDDKPMQWNSGEIAMIKVFAVLASAEVKRKQTNDQQSLVVRGLHDSVTQSLYSLTLLSEGWRRMAEHGQLERVETALSELGQISQQALREMRHLLSELRTLYGR
jgi:signal transduction histidine kinase